MTKAAEKFDPIETMESLKATARKLDRKYTRQSKRLARNVIRQANKGHVGDDLIPQGSRFNIFGTHFFDQSVFTMANRILAEEGLTVTPKSEGIADRRVINRMTISSIDLPNLDGNPKPTPYAVRDDVAPNQPIVPVDSAPVDTVPVDSRHVEA